MNESQLIHNRFTEGNQQSDRSDAEAAHQDAHPDNDKPGLDLWLC
jgi:hypothetical protein